MKEKQENYFIDFLRFVFSVCIVFYHSWMFAGEFGKGIFDYGYLAVDFYFIVTGYLMINSMYKTKKTKSSVLNESFHFVWNKMKRMFLPLLVTFLVGIIFVYGRTVIFDFKFLLSDSLFQELFQLGIFGYSLSVNSSWWYISAMFAVLILLYPFAIKYKKDYCSYIAPLIIVFTLGFVNFYKININDPNSIVLFFRNGFYKALIFIPMGNISYIIADIIKQKNFSKFKILILSALEVILYVMLVLNLHYSFIGSFLYAVLLMSNISLTFSNVTIIKNIFKHSIWKKIGTYGFYIFLCNVSIRTYMLRRYASLNLSYKQLLIRYILITCLVALFIYVIVEIIYKKIIKKRLCAKKH